MRVGEHVQTTGTLNGLELGNLDGKLVIVERCKLSLQQIDCLNCSSSVCKIEAVLQVDHNNPQIATKIAIASPSEDSESVVNLQTFVEKPGGTGFKAIIKTLLRNMLELRILLPPIYNLDPRYVFVDTKTNEARLVVSDVLFDRENAFIPHDMTKDDLRFKSPEELLGKERQLTTPFWVVGCLLYQLQFGSHPFDTHLKPRVMDMLIKRYPVVFPETDQDSDLKALLTEMLNKDPHQRIGSDTCEMEILQHAYFEE